MANFGPTDLVLQANIGQVQSPNWLTISPDAYQTDPLVQFILWPGLTITFSDWFYPGMPRTGFPLAPDYGPYPFNLPAPDSYFIVPYLYAHSSYTLNVGSSPIDVIQQDVSGVPVGPNGRALAWSTDNYMQLRWHWNSAGSFASPPQIRAARSGLDAQAMVQGGAGTGDARPVPVFPGLLSDGDTRFTTDAGGVPRAMLKANAFGGSGSSIPTPSSGPAAQPQPADGQTGVAVNNSGWLSSWQDLYGEFDLIEYGATPGGSQDWYFMIAPFITSAVQGQFTNIVQGPLLVLEYAFG